MTLQDIDEFKSVMDGWFANISTDLSRQILGHLDETLGKVADPRICEDLSEMRQILKCAHNAWEQGAYELAGSELERLKQRL